jgi:hypothetical protein
MIGELKLRMSLIKEGFPNDKLDDVVKLRTSMFADETDDIKAIGLIKDKFGATYMPKKELIDVPNEVALGNASTETHPINITRKTSIKELMIK